MTKDLENKWEENKEVYYGVCNRNFIVGFFLRTGCVCGTWRKPDAWDFCNGYYLDGFADDWQYAGHKSGFYCSK